MKDSEEIKISREIADKLIDYDDMPFNREDVKGVSVIISGDKQLLAKAVSGPKELRNALNIVAEYMAQIYSDPKIAAKSILKDYENWEKEKERTDS